MQRVRELESSEVKILIMNIINQLNESRHQAIAFLKMLCVNLSTICSSEALNAK